LIVGDTFRGIRNAEVSTALLQTRSSGSEKSIQKRQVEKLGHKVILYCYISHTKDIMLKKHLKTALVLFALLLHAVGLSPDQRVAPKTWQMADAVRYCNTRHMDTSIISRLIKLDLFRVNSTCTDSITVHTPLLLNDPEQSLLAIFSSGTAFLKAKALCEYLYTTVPELYIDDAKSHPMNYQINEKNIFPMLQNLQQSKEAAFCAQYAALTKTLLELNLSSIYSTTADVYDSTDIKFHHIVCFFYYKENDSTVGLVIDAMYGYLFPAKNSEAVTLSGIKDKKSDIKNYMTFIPDSILSQKRFLTDSIWPCNFLCENIFSYYKGLKGSLKKYELHQVEDIRLLGMQPLDTTAYTRGLYKALQKNKPEKY